MFKKRCFIAMMLLVLVVMISAACSDSSSEHELSSAQTRTITDREGYTITLPVEINSVVTLGPSVAEILVALGLGDRIIAADRFTDNVAGLGDGVTRDFGITDFDPEYVIELAPQALIVGSMTRAGGAAGLLDSVNDAGIVVIYIPPSESIAAIFEDIRFLADIMGIPETGDNIVMNMQLEIDEVRGIAQTITAPRSVYFEISPAPWMWGTGSGTFLHEMIEIAGAVNIFAEQETGFFAVSEEVLLEANPDIILTSTEFIDDPISEIKSRPGFDTLSAVQNNAIFRIDTAASNRASPNIIIALWQIARTVYPEYFT